MATKKTTSTITTRQIYDKVCAMEKMLKECLEVPPPLARTPKISPIWQQPVLICPCLSSDWMMRRLSCPALTKRTCSTGCRISPSS